MQPLHTTFYLMGIDHKDEALYFPTTHISYHADPRELWYIFLQNLQKKGLILLLLNQT